MMLQDEKEISELAMLFLDEGVKSYLEIGSKFGGSLAMISAILPPGSRIVSVDLPAGTKAWPQSEKDLRNLIERLKREGHDARVIWGNSQDAAIVEQVRALGPFDAVFIDADHRLPGVTRDFANYGRMGRLVAFHDIAWRRAPGWQGVRIDVPEFWDAIKRDYRHVEIKHCSTEKNNGIGVLWNPGQH